MIRHPIEVEAGLFRRQIQAAAAGGLVSPRDAVLASITASYFFLRRGLAILAFAFPFLLVIGAGVDHLQGSISAYYHYSADSTAYGAGTMRNVFVGVLWAVGAFLFLYKGYSSREDWALNIAGIAAPLIACFPTDWPENGARTWVGMVHYASAVTYFLAIAYVCIACSGETLKALADRAQRKRFEALYRMLGSAMVAVPLSVAALHFGLDRPEQRSFWIIAIEVAGIWIFAAFWLAKSREIAAIERQTSVVEGRSAPDGALAPAE